MRVAVATSPGSDRVPNEDAVCVSTSSNSVSSSALSSTFSSAHVAVVVDGVTAPAGLETGCIHGTPWYATHLAASMVAACADPRTDLRTALAEAITAVATTHSASCDLAADGTPSATLAAVREDARGSVEYLVLSDATVAFEAGGGQVTVVTDDRLTALLTDARHAVHAAPAGSEQRERLLRELVTAQRKLRNVPGGYWLAGTRPEAADYALTGSVPISPDLCVAAMTDGASRLVDMFEACTWLQAIQGLRRSGPDEWIRWVRNLEATDTAMTHWPRYKLSDDATVACCTFD